MKRQMKRSLLTLTVALALDSCGGDGDKNGSKEPANDRTCDPKAAEPCKYGDVCEPVDEGRFECWQPITVHGHVYDALEGTDIAGATIVGLDANGAARTRTVRSGADGRYKLPVSVRRNADGRPVQDSITLRVAAPDYQPFPSPPRSPVPISLDSLGAYARDPSTDANVKQSKMSEIPTWLENTMSDVALIALPNDKKGGATIEGTVAADEPGGVLVIAVADLNDPLVWRRG